MKAKLARQSAVGFVLRVTGAGITYLFVILLARMMDTAGFGLVGTIMSGALLFSVIGCAGQRMALLRFVPPEIENASAGPPMAIIGSSFRLALGGNLLIFILLLTIALVMGAVGRLDETLAIAVGLLIIPLMGSIDMQAHLARAYRSIVVAITPKDILWRLLSAAVLFALFLLNGSHHLPPLVVLAVLVAVLVFLIVVQGAVMHRWLGVPGIFRAVRSKTDNDAGEAWRRARFPLWIASITAIAFTNLDVVSAGVLVGPAAAALYFAANRVAMVPLLFNESYNIVIGPMFSAHHAGGRHDELRQVSRTAALHIFLPTLAATVFLWFAAGPILSLFGKEYVAAADVLRILLVSVMVNASFGPSDLLLTMCGQEKAAMRAGLAGTLGGAVAIIAGGLMGSPEEVAAGSLVAVIFARTLSWLSLRRTLGFTADVPSAILQQLRKRRNP